MRLTCEGTPGNECPTIRRGAGVKLIHDLELCDDCALVRFPPGYSTRGESRPPQGLEVIHQPGQVPPQPSFPSRVEPSAPPMEETSTGLYVQIPDSGTQATATTELAHATEPFVANELLCFITHKLDVMPLDMITKLCCDFYDSNAVYAAKKVLFDTCSSRKIELPRAMVKRRSTAKTSNDIHDIIQVIMGLETKEIPVFVARRLQDLPPLMYNNVDLSKMLTNIESLKNEMSMFREMSQSQQDILKAITNLNRTILQTGVPVAVDTSVPIDTIPFRNETTPSVNEITPTDDSTQSGEMVIIPSPGLAMLLVLQLPIDEM